MRYGSPVSNVVDGALLLTTDAARRLSVTPGRIRQLARAGRLRTALQTVSGVRLFTAADVEALRRQRARRRRTARQDQ
jgi:DNA-binding transcriptional MerR regulator